MTHTLLCVRGAQQLIDGVSVRVWVSRKGHGGGAGGHGRASPGATSGTGVCNWGGGGGARVLGGWWCWSGVVTAWSLGRDGGLKGGKKRADS